MPEPVHADVRHQHERRVVRDLRKRLRRGAQHRVDAVHVVAEVSVQEPRFLVRQVRALHHLIDVQAISLRIVADDHFMPP